MTASNEQKPATIEMPGAGIRRGVTEVPLELGRAGTAGGPAALAPGVGSGPIVSAILTVQAVTVDVVPQSVYNVYLANAKGEREQIGVIDFFSFSTGGGHQHASQDYQFDATDAVQSLGISSDAEARLVFEPSTGLDNSDPLAAAAAIAPDANVRYEGIKLEIAR